MVMTPENAAVDLRVNKLVEYLDQATRIVFLTGAGMSTDSGIPDFRSPEGIYNTTTSEDVFAIATFRRDPSQFYRVISPLYRQILNAVPNSGHVAIAHLEKATSKEIVVVTQNIDTLHSKAGSSVVHEIHGTLRTLTCQDCQSTFESETFSQQLQAGVVPRCLCGGVLKPDITFFGEDLPLAALYAAEGAMFNARLLIVLGTSMTVYPAAGLPRDCPGGVPFVMINQSPTFFDHQCDLIFRESISAILPEAVDRLLEQKSQ
ncbi:MAG: NAD-dependent deacylase [Thermoguttaceae bacterium]|nr:NAD-dependent deacylase [Thermoguttaceae bacterium]